MYEVLDDTAAQVILTVESGDSIRRVAQHLHMPYETVRQAVNRLEDAGYVSYDDGLTDVDGRVRDAALELVAASAGVSPPSIEEASYSHSSVTGRSHSRGSTPSTYGLRAATKLGGIQMTIRCSLLFVSKMSTPGRHSLRPSTFPPHSSDSAEMNWTDRCRSSSSHVPHSILSTWRGTR